MLLLDNTLMQMLKDSVYLLGTRYLSMYSTRRLPRLYVVDNPSNIAAAAAASVLL